jgi:hypothetical protein
VPLNSRKSVSKAKKNRIEDYIDDGDNIDDSDNIDYGR